MIAATPDAELELATSEPRDLAATLGFIRRGRADPTLHVVEGPRGWGEVWRAQRTPEGPATLRLLISGDHVRAQAWGPGATWSVDCAPALIGEHDDWRPLDDLLAARDDAASSALSRARRRRRGLRLTSTGIVVEAAVAAVLEQKVTGLEARRAWRRLVLTHGERAPGPAPEGLTVMPDGVGWRSIPDHEWHQAGVGPQRMDTIRRVSAAAASLDRLSEHEPARLESALRSIAGVGQWTVAEVLQRSHGHPDLVSVGDAHLPHVIGTWFTGDRVDDAHMLELLAPWPGHRQRVVRLITSLGVAVQSFGARATISDHRAR